MSSAENDNSEAAKKLAFPFMESALILLALTLVLFAAGYFIFVTQADEAVQSQMLMAISVLAGVSTLAGIFLFGILKLLAGVGYNVIAGCFLGMTLFRMFSGLVTVLLLKSNTQLSAEQLAFSTALFYLPLLTLEVILIVRFLTKLSMTEKMNTQENMITNEVAA